MKLTEKIQMPENIEGMSAEELRAFIEGIEVPDAPTENTVSSDEISRLKSALSKSNSEAADYRKKWQATLSEQERAEAERQQRDQEREARIAELEKKEAIGNFKANFLSTGYSAELAESSARAMVEGNNAQVFADMNAFIAEKTKQLQAEALNNQPSITNGSPVVQPAPEDEITSAFRKAIGL